MWLCVFARDATVGPEAHSTPDEFELVESTGQPRYERRIGRLGQIGEILSDDKGVAAAVVDELGLSPAAGLH
jgi:hypothetical protein